MSEELSPGLPPLKPPEQLKTEFAPKPSTPEAVKPVSPVDAVHIAARTLGHLANNELTHIMGAAQLATFDPGLTDESRDYLEQISVRTEKLAGVIAQMARTRRMATVESANGPILDTELASMSDEEYEKYLESQKSSQAPSEPPSDQSLT